MAKVRSARKVSEELAKRKDKPAAQHDEPAVGAMFFGLLLAFVGGAVAMLAWDASRIPLALLGTRWEEAVPWTTRLAVGVPGWLWTMLLFLASAAVAFSWMVKPARRRPVVAWGAAGLAVVLIAVLAHGLFQPVGFDKLGGADAGEPAVPPPSIDLPEPPGGTVGAGEDSGAATSP